MPKTKGSWVVKDAFVPFSFKRGQCFLCDAEAVTRIADEPVCATHQAVIEDIRRAAPAPERERERVA